MKFFIVVALFVAAAVAVPVDDREAYIISQELNNLGLGGYSSNYETSNGIRAGEEGRLENVGTDDEGMAVRGGYSYIGPDGVTYAVSYTADRFGFQPQGAHIPQAP